ncbi:Uncharacterised protein [Mycobacteroides abscessus]|nr:Uncharacterised protein [Mycobacteroides abscessus]
MRNSSTRFSMGVPVSSSTCSVVRARAATATDRFASGFFT